MTGCEKVGFQIRNMRRQCGYTQEKLANDLFISQSYLRLIEHGKANPSTKMVEKIVSYLESALNSENPEEVV